MKAVLRLALTYFSIVPLQKWVSIAGAALFAATLLVRSPAFGVAAMLGAVIVVISPLMVGGAAMRFASSQGTLQLRPGGRWKMLAAALLVACVMTAIVALALWATLRPVPRSPVSIREVAALWGIFSLIWLFTFIASASRTWATVMVAILIAAINSRNGNPCRRWDHGVSSCHRSPPFRGWRLHCGTCVRAGSDAPDGATSSPMLQQAEKRWWLVWRTDGCAR